MLSEQEIQQALRASRVVPIGVANPHGPLGMEQLRCTVAELSINSGANGKKVVRSEVSTETWQKLEKLADEATRCAARPVSVSEVAGAILQHYVAEER
jgi:hypothetical protein